MFTQSGTLLRRAVRAADALAAPHGIDRYLEQVVPTWSSTEVRGRITAVDRSAVGSVVLTVRPNGNWTGFRPGQYTQLTVEIDGVRHTRCYSMATSATDAGSFQLGVRSHEHGLVSRHLLHHVAVGDVVGLTPARGEFHLPAQRPERTLLVSGGSGITPVLSMARTLAAEGHRRPVTFLHYARSRSEQLFASVLEQLAADNPWLQVVCAYDDEPDGVVAGLFAADHLDTVDPEWRRAEIFVCGPGPLMDAVHAVAETAGRAGHVHHEAFALPQLVAEAAGAGGSIRFAASDLEVEADGRSVLDQAESAGLAPEHGCRMGICHTCTASLCDGSVQNLVSGEVTSATPESPVDIRVCVNAPIGDVAVQL